MSLEYSSFVVLFFLWTLAILFSSVLFCVFFSSSPTTSSYSSSSSSWFFACSLEGWSVSSFAVSLVVFCVSIKTSTPDWFACESVLGLSISDILSIASVVLFFGFHAHYIVNQTFCTFVFFFFRNFVSWRVNRDFFFNWVSLIVLIGIKIPSAPARADCLVLVNLLVAYCIWWRRRPLLFYPFGWPRDSFRGWRPFFALWGWHVLCYFCCSFFSVWWLFFRLEEHFFCGRFLCRFPACS